MSSTHAWYRHQRYVIRLPFSHNCCDHFRYHLFVDINAVLTMYLQILHWPTPKDENLVQYTWYHKIFPYVLFSCNLSRTTVMGNPSRVTSAFDYAVWVERRKTIRRLHDRQPIDDYNIWRFFDWLKRAIVNINTKI